jgi:LCP family protein required for cell wall assembly
MNDGLDFLFERAAPDQPARPPDAPARPADAPKEHRWSRRLRRLALTGIILVAAGTVGVLASEYITGTDLTGRIGRVGEVFGGAEVVERPPTSPAATSSRTILVVGSELRGPDPDPDLDAEPEIGPSARTTEPGAEPADGEPDNAPAEEPSAAGERAGAVMLIRLDPGHNSASVVSIPHQARVDVPGHDATTISAAHALGGPALLVDTVEQLTAVRIDHFMVLDFAELAPIVDVLNGVDVVVADAIGDRAGGQFRAGVNHLDGDRALAYLRQPDLLPEDAVDRTQRQQNLLRAVLAKAASTPPDGNALENYRLLDAVTRAFSVDDSVTPDELRGMARAAARLEPGNIWFLTAPVQDTSPEIDGVQLDQEGNAQLWQAFHTGKMAEYVAEHPDILLSTNPR